MPAPEFEWKTYEVPARRAPAETALIHIPELTVWPTPLDKARLLLETAAEVEHALLVQYLYAAFALDTGLPDAAQRDAVTDWSGTLHAIARQEMGHLMTVQ